MRFSVDSWDPSYDSGLELEALPQSAVQVDTTIEVSTTKWAPIPAFQADGQTRDLLFVDGVRRIDARVWIDDAASERAWQDASPCARKTSLGCPMRSVAVAGPTT